MKTAWSEQVGTAQFDDLCECFVKDYPSWFGKLRKKHTHYPAFLKFPERRPFSTTNQVEAAKAFLDAHEDDTIFKAINIRRTGELDSGSVKQGELDAFLAVVKGFGGSVPVIRH